MAIPTEHLLILSLVLLAIGIAGVLIRRNVIIILMSIELILNAANINFVAFSRQWNNLTGQIFGVFNITIAAAEVAVGLAIVIALFRNRETVNVDEMNLMKW
jgi:NADH-quinone oxidoreductase subunit K